MKNRSGFTLIEVLTVIGIIAIVAAIIFPVFVSVREHGRRTSCQNNLRQISVGIEMYVHDNDGLYPLPFVWQSSVYSYVRSKEAFVCPDNPQNYSGSIPLYDTGIIDYAFDTMRLDVFPPPYPSKNVRGISETALTSPPMTWLNMDRVWSDNTGDHFLRVVSTPCGENTSFVAGANTLHSGGGNYSFVDGHVRWLTPEGFGEAECAAGPLPFPF